MPAINLKCGPKRVEELRATFNDIKLVYHMNKMH